jgi:hypothetical protein
MEDAAQGLDWSLLLPDFAALAPDGTFAAQELSAVIILVLLLAAGWALAVLYVHAVAVTRSIGFLLRTLEGIAPENAVRKRYSVRRAAQKSEYEGALWSRFDQSLVVSADGLALQSTEDCAHVFNLDNLARHALENRILRALPGILPSLGLLGTVGVLQLGFSGVPWTAAGSASGSLVDGFALAFACSAWGAGVGVIVQISLRATAGLLRRRVSRLQQRINRLFPRAGIQQMQGNPEHSGERAEVTPANLKTQVDGHMRGILDAVAAEVQASLSQAMAPALDKLNRVSDELAARRDAPALEAVVEEQRSVLERLGADVEASLENLNAGLGPLAQSLELKVDSYAALAEQHAETLQARLDDLAGRQQDTLDKADSVLQLTLEGAEQFMLHAGQSKQRDKATRELIQDLDTARYNIELTVDELKRRAQLANQTLDQLEVGYTAFLEDVSKSATDSGTRMSNLLVEYSHQLGDQTRERLSDWKQMNEEFSRLMADTLAGLQANLQTTPSAPAKQRPARSRKRNAAPQRAPKSS